MDKLLVFNDDNLGLSITVISHLSFGKHYNGSYF